MIGRHNPLHHDGFQMKFGEEWRNYQKIISPHSRENLESRRVSLSSRNVIITLLRTELSSRNMLTLQATILCLHGYHCTIASFLQDISTRTSVKHIVFNVLSNSDQDVQRYVRD